MTADELVARVLGGLSLSQLAQAWQKARRSRRRGFVFSLNGRFVVMPRRIFIQKIEQEVIDRGSNE